MHTTIGTILGFDYGQQRIGVAVGQTLISTARPLRILTSQQQCPDWQSISALIQEWQPNALVVGLPLHADGSEGEIARAARRFSQQLAGRYGLPVYTIEETLSSVDAEHRQREHCRRKQRHARVDAVAAQIILETWLAEQ